MKICNYTSNFFELLSFQKKATILFVFLLFSINLKKISKAFEPFCENFFKFVKKIYKKLEIFYRILKVYLQKAIKKIVCVN